MPSILLAVFFLPTPRTFNRYTVSDMTAQLVIWIQLDIAMLD